MTAAEKALQHTSRQRSSEYTAFVDSLTEQLKSGLAAQTTDKTDAKHNMWLQVIYEQRTQRFINDNNKIWTTGSIFIPLSLAGLAGFKDLTPASITLLGVGSVLLMFFWVLIADNHRAFQTKSHAITEAIEAHIGIDCGHAKLGKPTYLKKLHFLSAPYARYSMLLAVLAVWGYAVKIKKAELATPSKDKPTESLIMTPTKGSSAVGVTGSQLRPDSAYPVAPATANHPLGKQPVKN